MKKLILLIVLLLSFASVAFSYEEVEATDFIKQGFHSYTIQQQ